MRSLNLATKAILIVYLLSAGSGCFEPSNKCRPYIKGLIGLSTEERNAKFHTYNLDTQYEIYICGMQEIEPPIDFSSVFAVGGVRVVELLKGKLLVSQSDETVSDIIRVFAEIERIGTYDVVGDKPLTTLINNSYSKINDSYWRRISEKYVKYINNPR